MSRKPSRGPGAATKYCTAYAYGAIETTEQPPSLLTPSSIDVDRIIIRITLQQTIFSFMTPVTNNRITLHQAIFFRVLAYIKTSNASLHHPMTPVPSDTCDSTDLRQPPKAQSFSQIHLVTNYIHAVEVTALLSSLRLILTRSRVPSTPFNAPQSRGSNDLSLASFDAKQTLLRCPHH